MVAPPRRPANFRIEQSRLLLVEGNDDAQFFRRIIERRQSEGTQIIDFGGKDKLGEFLTSVLVPRVKATDIVRIIGVVRDADEYPDRAFQSVSDSLRRAGLPVPNSPATPANGSLDGAEIQILMHIMPDNVSTGDLETLCLTAVRDTVAMTCVDGYIECLQTRGQTVQHERKARLHAYLASHPGDPTLQPGQAIDAGIIPWDSPAFEAVHRFLDVLDAAS